MTLLIPSRRGFLTGLASLLAAPAVVRAASLMPVRALQAAGITNWQSADEVCYSALHAKNSWLTAEAIAREAVQLFRNSNEFLRNIDTQYTCRFAADGSKIGSILRIRLPSDFAISARALHPPIPKSSYLQWDRANVPA